ncbi:MAG: Hsp20/alpha crystallin family protein [Chloroflexi bacterium]|nr:Hsp20/alpha crystallin family protein [Chloroflexota bacterium]
MTSINRWNPVRELLSIRDEMDRIFSERFFRMENRPMLLPIDAYMTDEALVLVADVPGLKPEDIHITFEGDTLTIRGEYKASNDTRNYLLRERAVGKFERVLTINTPVDSNKIEADFENGLLTLKLPKAEAAKPKQITVRAKTSTAQS